jgi:hypothetical protein
LVAAFVALTGTACSTVPPSQNEARLDRLVEELNTADEDRLVELCALPFLLDGETVVREEDLRVLWRNLRASGFTFADARIAGIREAGPDSYKTFSDDPEVHAFFKKHTGKNAAVIDLETDHGAFSLLTGGRVGRYGRLPKLYGFTGPEAE